MEIFNFKCKYCGGELSEVEGLKSVGKCKYCGSKQTLPKLENEKRANLFERANHLRRNNEFDKAESLYEQLLNEDLTDPEAYWSLVLCRYGIEYVEDSRTKERVPTVNRTQMTSIFGDEDYKSAIANADAEQKALYEAEANIINEIQKGILEISRKEEPFDIFICYKETDENGKRSRDSILAQDLYHELTRDGYKVFFARVTLQGKLGSAYEPYIFSALNSSKVMVVLGTKKEHFEAVWVRNEWSRFLGQIKKGERKVLIPAYRDMDAYDLPVEFSNLQALDMSRLGFLQELVEGVENILNSYKKKETPREEPKAAPAPAPRDERKPVKKKKRSKAVPMIIAILILLGVGAGVVFGSGILGDLGQGTAETQDVTTEDDSAADTETDDIVNNYVGKPGDYTYTECHEPIFVYSSGSEVTLYYGNNVKAETVEHGTELVRIGVSTDGNHYWSRVLYNGSERYILTELLSKLSLVDDGFVAVRKTVTVSSSVNTIQVRSIPTTTGGSIVGYLDANAKVTVVAENTKIGWYKIEFIPAGSEELALGYIKSDSKYFAGASGVETDTESDIESDTETDTETETDTDTDVGDNVDIENAVTVFEEDVAYYGVLSHKNLGKLVYLSGQMDGMYYLGEVDTVEAAAKVYFEKADFNYYMYFLDQDARVYINVIVDGQYLSFSLDSAPDTVWHYNNTYGCPMTNINGELIFIGTSDTGTYTNFCAKRITDGSTFFKLQFISAGVDDGGDNVDGECKHTNVEIVICEKICKDCGVVLGTEHSGETTIDKDTCDILCAECGRFLRKGTHKLEIDIYDNCNYKCVLCGHVEEEGRHQELIVDTVDPTASSEGWMITRCKDCNAIVSEDVIPPLGDGGSEDDTSLKINGAVSSFKDGTAYYAVLAHQNLGKRLYLTGQIESSYYLAATETYGSAANMYVKSVSDDEYYIYFEVEKVRYYVNIIADGQYFDIQLEETPNSVWSYDPVYGTMITSVNDTWLFLGTSSAGTYNNICIKSIDYVDEFFKLQFVEAEGYVEDPEKENAETVTVSTADDLLDTISKLNSGEISKYSTIELSDDIDLSGKSFTPINEFRGTFDGKGHTISNISLSLSGKSMTITDGNYSSYDITAIGFIGSAYDATIRGLTLDGVTADINTTKNIFIGALIGFADGVTVEDCTVNSTLDVTVNDNGTSGVSGLIGYSLDASTNGVSVDCNMIYTGNSTEAFAGAVLGVGNIRVQGGNIVLDISFTGSHYGHSGYLIGMERTPAGVTLTSVNGATINGSITVKNPSGYCMGSVGQGASYTIDEIENSGKNTIDVTVDSNATRS